MCRWHMVLQDLLDIACLYDTIACCHCMTLFLMTSNFYEVTGIIVIWLCRIRLLLHKNSFLRLKTRKKA